MLWNFQLHWNVIVHNNKLLEWVMSNLVWIATEKSEHSSSPSHYAILCSHPVLEKKRATHRDMTVLCQLVSLNVSIYYYWMHSLNHHAEWYLQLELCLISSQNLLTWLFLPFFLWILKSSSFHDVEILDASMSRDG